MQEERQSVNQSIVFFSPSKKINKNISREYSVLDQYFGIKTSLHLQRGSMMINVKRLENDQKMQLYTPFLDRLPQAQEREFKLPSINQFKKIEDNSNQINFPIYKNKDKKSDEQLALKQLIQKKTVKSKSSSQYNRQTKLEPINNGNEEINEQIDEKITSLQLKTLLEQTKKKIQVDRRKQELSKQKK